jgi:hypothetical protein
MNHRTVNFQVREQQPRRWCWDIYPPNRHVAGSDLFATREQAVAACIEEINNGIERTNRRQGSPALTGAGT